MKLAALSADPGLEFVSDSLLLGFFITRRGLSRGFESRAFRSRRS
jgi:hypothetical protein